MKTKSFVERLKEASAEAGSVLEMAMESEKKTLAAVRHAVGVAKEKLPLATGIQREKFLDLIRRGEAFLKAHS